MEDVGDIKVIGCKRDDCPISSGGVCIQDFEHAEDCDQAITQTSKAIKPKEEFRRVSPGTGLSLENLATMLLDRDIPTAAVIGAGASGKTTFLAMLFHRFLRHSDGFSGYRFMDSQSFLALNEKLHYADMRSRSTSVQMPRTSLEEEPVFHFKTKDKSDQSYECLWIDIPGEAMKQGLSKVTSAWHDYRGLARSTHVMLFLDLEIVADRSKRGPHVEQAIDTLVNSIQTNTWNGKNLLVVFSKSDAFAKKISNEIESIKSRFLTRLGDDFKAIEFCELHSLGAEKNAEKSIAQVWQWLHAAN